MNQVDIVVDGAPIAMIMVDGEGRIALANSRAASMFGYAHAELPGQRIELLVPGLWSDEQAGDSCIIAAGPRPSATESPRQLLGHRKDGTELPVQVNLSPLQIVGSQYELVSITDVDERLRVEQEATLYRDELAHLSRVAMLGEISGSLAHELSQPLTAILSNAQAALRFLERDSPDLGEVRESLIHVVENDKRAGEVLRRLRAMLRKERIDYQELDINEIVQEVLRLVNSDLLNRNVAVTLDLAPYLPGVRGDRVQLQQVLLNLIINACDAMGEMDAGRDLTVRSRLVPGPSVEVSVIDIGHGIPPVDLERIFAPFFTSKTEGMGLGLAVCRTIVQAHRGNLWATNNAANGSTLHLLLPALERASTPVDAMTSEEIAARQRLDRRRWDQGPIAPAPAPAPAPPYPDASKMP